MRNITTKLVNHLTSLSKRRSNHTVTSDDAQRILDRWNYTSTRNIIGGALRSNFRSVGYTRSKVRSNRGRTIRLWKNV